MLTTKTKLNQIAPLFIQNGATIGSTNTNGDNCIHELITRNRALTFKQYQFLKKDGGAALWDKANAQGNRPIHIAIENENEVWIDGLLDCGSQLIQASDIPTINIAKSLLEWRTKVLDFRLTKKIIKRFIEDYQCVREHCDPALKARMNLWLDFTIQNSERSDFENPFYKELREIGLEPSVPENNDSVGLLNMAIKLSDLGCYEELYSNKSLILYVNKYNETALHSAAQCYNYWAMDLLLQCDQIGEIINQKNSKNRTALDILKLNAGIDAGVKLMETNQMIARIEELLKKTTTEEPQDENIKMQYYRN